MPGSHSIPFTRHGDPAFKRLSIAVWTSIRAPIGNCRLRKRPQRKVLRALKGACVSIAARVLFERDSKAVASLRSQSSSSNAIIVPTVVKDSDDVVDC